MNDRRPWRAYYPNVSETYAYRNSVFRSIDLSYVTLDYEFGATVDIGSSPYVDLGYAGQTFHGKGNAPSDTTVASPFVGVGCRF